jgi:hypothetical protein
VIRKSAIGVANLANAEGAENHMFKFSNPFVALTLPGCKFAVCWRLPLPALKFMATNGSGKQDLGYFMMRITRSRKHHLVVSAHISLIFRASLSMVTSFFHRMASRYTIHFAIIEKIASPNYKKLKI